MKLFVQFWFCFFITSFAVAQGPCNNATSVTYQGYQYDLVEIGDQCWFKENLRADKWSNGDPIPQPLYFENPTSGLPACMPTFDEIGYGYWYNWGACIDSRQLCPSGFHVPTIDELEELLDAAGSGDELIYGEFQAVLGGLWYGNGDLFSHTAFFQSTDVLSEPNSSIVQQLKLVPSSNDEWGETEITNNTIAAGVTVRCIASESFLAGCTNPEASNYDPTATADDGSCTYPPGPCNGATSITYQGYEYDIVEIGDQCWFAENLRATKYLNNDPILDIAVDDPSLELGVGARLVYGSDSIPFGSCEDEVPEFEACDEVIALEEFGRLYNFYAILDNRKICPVGWRVPTDNDWKDLEFELGMSEADLHQVGWRGDIASTLKSQTTYASEGNGTNSSGFNGKAHGSASGNNTTVNFMWAGIFPVWWSSTQAPLEFDPNPQAWCRGLDDNLNSVWRDGYDYDYFRATRCMKNLTAIVGCTIEEACNFNPDASEDDGSCLFIGESCDDEDETTSNDMVQDDCICAGEVIEGCTYSVACNYDPLATLFDDSCVYPGDECDDNNDLTTNDAYSENCECLGEPIEVILGCIYETACNFNPEANQDDMSCLFPGDSCDDEDVTTGNDTYTEDCECVGEPLIGGCTYESACNFNPDAQFDDSSCIFIGDSCDDGDSATENDVINMDCDCVGTPITSVSEVGLVAMTVYPNPVSDQLTIELGTQQGTLVRVQIFDAQGKLVFDESRVDRILLDVSAYTPGAYTIQAGEGADRKQVQFIVE